MALLERDKYKKEENDFTTEAYNGNKKGFC